MVCVVIYNDKGNLCWQIHCEEHVFKWKSLLVKGNVLEQAYTNCLKIVRARMLFNGKIK